MIAEVGKEDDDCNYYTFTLDDIRNCDVTKWYTEFKDITVPTLTFAIGPELIKYLTGTSIQRGQRRTTLGNLGRIHVPTDAWTSDLEQLGQLTLNGGAEDEFSDIAEDETTPPSAEHELSDDDDEEFDENMYLPPKEIISETIDKMTSRINELGGSVIPKLNWVAPKDAAWLGFNHSMKCQSSGEIFLLLKVSERIVDLATDGLKKYISNVPDPSPLEFHVVLRKWIDSLSLDMEFRCFVCDERLTAICQRDTEVGYYTVSEPRDSIIKDIHEFFCDSIHGRFPSNFYVFDVARLSAGKVVLLDFGVFGLPTDPLLFTYRELKMLMDEIGSNLNNKTPSTPCASGLRNVVVYGEPYFRYLTPDHSIRPLMRNVVSPSDIVTYLREGATND